MNVVYLTNADVSIDIICAILFTVVVFHSLKYLWLNHITTAGKIKYLFIIAVGLTHVFQTTFQLLTGHSAFVRLWDINNFVVAFFLLMVVHRMALNEKL